MDTSDTNLIVKTRKPRTNRRYKYIVKVNDDDNINIFFKKYCRAIDINNDFELLTKDKVSDILCGRYKGQKRQTKSFFNTIEIERINELL